MTAWIVPALVTGFAFAILGVQYAAFKWQRRSQARFGLEAHCRLNHIDDVLASLRLELGAHAAESQACHRDTEAAIAETSANFSDRADALTANATALKVHAQELLDRSEARAINSRQAVTHQ